MNDRGRIFIYVFISFLLSTKTDYSNAQTLHTKKEINQQVQVWASINSTLRFNRHWGVLGDFHVRRTNFLADPSFYFLRFGANYWITESMTAAFGYAHMWNAPSREVWTTWSNENRIYQQFLFTLPYGKTSITHRFRNEQRWKEKIVNDVKTGEILFTDRFRYLLSMNFRVFKNPKMPSLVVADEILLQFGKEVVYNTFDQNRLFLGIKQSISPKLSFDFGYMNVYQQKYSGYQYDMNHTIRLFFYYNGGWKPGKKNPVSEHHDE